MSGNQGDPIGVEWVLKSNDKDQGGSLEDFTSQLSERKAEDLSNLFA